MVDHKKSIGTQEGSYMMIRDTGSTVEFWLKSGSAYTWAQSFPISWIVNGSSGSGTASYNYPFGGGAPYPAQGPLEKVKSFSVTTSQYVTFNLGATGTTGLNGPTSFKVYIERATVPPAPDKPVISNITATTAYVTFTDNGNGGSAITARRIGYGTSSTSVQSWISSDGSTTVTGLTPGKTYYFWAQVQNAKGWSALSPRAQAMTLGGAQVKVGTVYKHAMPFVRHSGVWKPAYRWVKYQGVWKRHT